MKKSVIIILGGLMAISAASADISVVDTAALVAIKGDLGTRRLSAALVDLFLPELKDTYKKSQPSIGFIFEETRNLIKDDIANFLAREISTWGCIRNVALKELSLLLKPRADQLEAGAQPVTWYVAAAKNYAYRDDARLDAYAARLQNVIDRYFETGGNASITEVVDAQKAIDEIKNAATRWQQFDDRENRLSQVLANPEEATLEAAITALNDFVEKNKLVISTQYNPLTKLGVTPDQTTLRDRIQSILTLQEKAKDKLQEIQGFVLPVCAPQEELTQAEQKLQGIINAAQQQNITSGSRKAGKYIKEIDNCITPVYNQIKDEKIKPRDSKLLLEAVKKIKDLGGYVTALSEAEAALKTLTTQMQNELKGIRKYEDAAVTVKPNGITFAVSRDQGVSYLNALDMNRGLSFKISELQKGLIKDFLHAAEYYFTLSGKDLQAIMTASLEQEEEGLLAQWRKTLFGKTWEEQAREVLQSITNLDRRIALFKELIDLVPKAEEQSMSTDLGVLNVARNENTTNQRREFLKTFASSRAILDASGDFGDMDVQEKQAIVDHALPEVWFAYKKDYQKAYNTKEESSLIKTARRIMERFIATTRNADPIPQIQ